MADWQVGDLALCVKTPVSGDGATCQVRSGQVHTVAALHTSRLTGNLGLELAGITLPHNGINAISAYHFRKITPGAKIEGIEEPRRVKVDA